MFRREKLFIANSLNGSRPQAAYRILAVPSFAPWLIAHSRNSQAKRLRRQRSLADLTRFHLPSKFTPFAEQRASIIEATQNWQELREHE
jgi:hypothetical protein